MQRFCRKTMANDSSHSTWKTLETNKWEMTLSACATCVTMRSAKAVRIRICQQHNNKWLFQWMKHYQTATMLTMVRFHPWFKPRMEVVSRVLDQELMCALMEKIQDLMRNIKWNGNDEFPRRVLLRWRIILRACGNKSISPWQNMRTVLAILPMKMSIPLEHSIKHGAISMGA